MVIELFDDGKRLRLTPDTTQEDISLGIFYGENAEHPNFGYSSNCVVFDLRTPTKRSNLEEENDE